MGTTLRGVAMPDGRHAQRYVEGGPDALPAGYALPPYEAMAPGDVVCDHSCDVEHVQVVDGTEYVTSIVWTTDGGIGPALGPAEAIGCQWLASVSRLSRKASWREDRLFRLMELVLDCETDTDDEVARRTCHDLLARLVAGGDCDG